MAIFPTAFWIVVGLIVSAFLVLGSYPGLAALIGAAAALLLIWVMLGGGG